MTTFKDKMNRTNKKNNRLYFGGIKVVLQLYVFLFIGINIKAQDQIIGSKSYIHIEKINDVWWLVDADGEKFVSTGMNHLSSRIRFANYNKDFWIEKFGKKIYSNGKINQHAKTEIKAWMAQAVKDHQDFGFNTMAFHRDKYLPDEYFNELKIFYLGKIKTADVHARRVKNSGSKFPDVFSEEFKSHAEKVAKVYCSKHKESKYLIGYTYDDLPSYSFEEYNRKIKYEGHRGGLLFHPWVIDIINVEEQTIGKDLWISILKKHYKSSTEAAENYLLEINSWEDLASISDWKKPKNEEKWQRDQTEMLKQIVAKWHEVNRNSILKYDPNHLIFGDKVSCHGKGHPDWVFQVLGQYVDVLLIQDYEFFKPSHVKKMERYYIHSGKPVLNGDHSYGCTVPEMRKAKGLPVESHSAMGEEYHTYLKGIMNMPFMVGWHNCGYLEQWQGSKTDATGKEQTGFFDPYGNPRTEALNHVKKANENAVTWHKHAGRRVFEYSQRK